MGWGSAPTVWIQISPAKVSRLLRKTFRSSCFLSGHLAKDKAFEEYYASMTDAECMMWDQCDEEMPSNTFCFNFVF